jgi:hypothetical protein
MAPYGAPYGKAAKEAQYQKTFPEVLEESPLQTCGSRQIISLKNQQARFQGK